MPFSPLRTLMLV